MAGHRERVDRSLRAQGREKCHAVSALDACLFESSDVGFDPAHELVEADRFLLRGQNRERVRLLRSPPCKRMVEGRVPHQ